MDFGSAALLVVATFALTEFVKAMFKPGFVDTPDGRRLTVLIALVAGQAAVWGLGLTVWANEQVISGHKLTDLNTGSRIAAGLFLAALAAGLQRGLDAVKNVGENQPPKLATETQGPEITRRESEIISAAVIAAGLQRGLGGNGHETVVREPTQQV